MQYANRRKSISIGNPVEQNEKDKAKGPKGLLRSKSFDEGSKALIPPPPQGQQVGGPQAPGQEHPPEEVALDQQPDQAPPEVQHVQPPGGQQHPAGPKAPLAFEPGGHEQVAQVAVLVGHYNDLSEQATHQQRFAALRAIDTEVYRVFRENPVQELTQLPFAAGLKALLRETTEAHADLVDDLRQRAAGGEDGHLPLDATGMTEEEKAEASQTFTSMARGEGDLKFEGSAGFQKKSFGQVAKLMQGPLGRQLVGFANRKEQAPEGGQAPDKSITIQPSEHDPAAGALDTTASDMRQGGESDAPNVDPQGLTRAMLSGERHVTMGGRRYDFGQGSGGHIGMPEEIAESRTQDEDGHEILTPDFITLGHELGHAAKAKAGAKSTDVDLRQVAPGQNPANWVNSAEEYANVKGVENPLRAEHGMKQRGDYTASVKMQRVNRLRQQVGLVSQQVQGNEAMNLVMQALRACSNNRMGDDQVYQQVTEQVNGLLEQARQVHQQQQQQQHAPPPPQQQEQRGGFRGMMSRAGDFFRHGFRRRRDR